MLLFLSKTQCFKHFFYVRNISNIYFLGDISIYSFLPLIASFPIVSSYSTLENNIFFTKVFYWNGYNYGLLDGTPYSNVKNNLFVDSSNIPANVLALNNIFRQPINTIFIDETGSASSYQLNPASPGKNGGTDGTDIGIHGGAFPWKQGAIPSNPHFQSIQIAPKTDTNGNLNVKIKVAAQDH